MSNRAAMVRGAGFAEAVDNRSSLVEDVIEQGEGTVRVRVRVQPRASRTEIVGRFGDALKVRVASSPVDGAANRELIRLISKRLGVAASRVRVLAGETSRSKLIEIAAVDHSDVRKALLE